jgi:hypothetical protein
VNKRLLSSMAKIALQTLHTEILEARKRFYSEQKWLGTKSTNLRTTFLQSLAVARVLVGDTSAEQ